VSGVAVWEPVTACVRDFDAEGVADRLEEELKASAGDAAVSGGVVRKFGHDELRGVQRQAPGAQLFRGE
jgi:hypothetical protein